MSTPDLPRVAPASGPHGGDGAAIAAALGLDVGSIIDLSASLNPFAPDVASIAARHLDSLRSYPDDRRATESVAAMLGVDVDRVVLTNGGAEAIALVATEIGVGAVVDPEFALYRRHLAHIDPSAPRWRSNPGNPLGRLARAEETAGVWDEAFFPLATGTWTRGDEESWRLGSLTKVWACPGLRLGYVIAPDASGTARLRARQPQWSVGGLALAVVDELIALTDLPAWATSIRSLRGQFAADLRSLGHAVIDTDCNWLLIAEAGDLRARLVAERVVVRDCTSFAMAGTIRVALPRPADYDAVLTAFDRVKKS
ncbi:MAG: aminotransferase class I/II-fold pyridoxal phosphate-dependent enzyme [Acidimicrobiia bacterium]